MKLTNKECVQFTIKMIQILETYGFYVRNIQETYVCLNGMVEEQVRLETDIIMEEHRCQSCRHISGSKSIDQKN